MANASETTSAPKGYPIVLGAGSPGGIWYGDPTEGSDRPESVDYPLQCPETNFQPVRA
jgi:hypothetical protein